MIERVEQRFGLKPERLIGDTAYGAAPMLAWLVDDKGIEPHVPVWDKTQRKDGTLSSTDFVGMSRPTSTAVRRATAAQPVARVQQPARPSSPTPAHHLPREPARLQGLPDEASMLPEHTDPQDRTQCS